MMKKEPHGKVSEAPTNPRAEQAAGAFDVAELYRGPLSGEATPPGEAIGLDEKLRQAYFWIVNNAIISPYYDIEYQEGASPTFTVGDLKGQLVLPSGQS